MTRRVEYHPDAIEEAARAFDWYAEQGGPAVAERFEEEVRAAVREIVASPGTWPRFGAGDDRKYVLRSYPFVIVYAEHDQVIRVKAIADARKRPGYWNRRTF